MKKLLLAGASVIAVASAAPASAADLSVKAPMMMAPAVFSWTGCYVGAHVGHAWGKTDTQGISTNGAPTTYNTGSMDVNGSIFGGQLGCNYQVAPTFVIGVEGSYSGAGITGIAGYGDGSGANCCFVQMKTDALASITGRLGWTGWDPRTLFYVKGGWAYAHDQFAFSYALTEKQDRSGWVVGFGVEWAFAQNWSVFAEYDHYDFGTKRTPNSFGPTSTSVSSVDITQKFDSVRVGANYKFNLFH
jgi:outer membrane immunogenic protein